MCHVDLCYSFLTGQIQGTFHTRFRALLSKLNALLRRTVWKVEYRTGNAWFQPYKYMHKEKDKLTPKLKHLLMGGDLSWLKFLYSTFLHSSTFKKTPKFPLKEGRRKGAGRERGREENRKMLLFTRPQVALLGTAVQGTALSGGFLWAPGRQAACAHVRPCSLSWLPPTPLDTHQSVTFGSTWFPLSLLAGSHKASWQPPTGSHGYPRLPDRRLLWTDGCQHWAGSRVRGPLRYPSPCILLFAPSPTQCTNIHTQTSFPSFCLVWPWQGTQDILNITKIKTTIAYLFRTPIRQWPMKCFAHKGEEIIY